MPKAQHLTLQINDIFEAVNTGAQIPYQESVYTLRIHGSLEVLPGLGERRGYSDEQFLHCCWNRDQLTVIVIAHFDGSISWKR